MPKNEDNDMLAQVEKAQAELRENIEQSKQLAEKAQDLVRAARKQAPDGAE